MAKEAQMDIAFKPAKRHWVFLVVALLFLTLAGVVSVFFSDIAVGRYDTYAQAKQEGALERGWLPKLLPTSAYDIFEKHNIDTNEIEGYFRYKEADEPALLEQIEKGEENFVFEVVPAQNFVQFRAVKK